jgi:hypothetical protein
LTIILINTSRYMLFRAMNKHVPATNKEVGSYILCAFNLGEAADEVVKTAGDLGALLKHPVMLLCSYRLIQSKASEEVQVIKKRYETLAAEKLKQISKTQSAIKLSFRAEIGFLSDRIESFVKTEKVKYLVIGNETTNTINEQKGLSLKEFVDKVGVPVLVVPDKGK